MNARRFYEHNLLDVEEGAHLDNNTAEELFGQQIGSGRLAFESGHSIGSRETKR